MIGSAVGSILTSLNSSLALGLLNSDGSYNIFPNYVKMYNKNIAPQLVYDLDNFEPSDCMDGDDRVPTIELKIQAVAMDYDSADTLGTAVAVALSGTSGTWGSTVVLGCFLKEVSEDHFVDTDMETILYYTKSLTFDVIYKQ